MQIPSKLLPYNEPNLAPNGVGPLRTPVNDYIYSLSGNHSPDRICGVYRNYLFFLADQEGERILAPFTLNEIFSNVVTHGDAVGPDYTPVNFPANSLIEDIQSQGFLGSFCLQNGDYVTFTQKFKITINDVDYFPSTTINITKGNEGELSKLIVQLQLHEKGKSNEKA